MKQLSHSTAIPSCQYNFHQGSENISSKFESLKHFRNELYNNLGQRKDATLDLLDALSSKQPSHTSVTDLSLSFHFKRKYPSIRDGIHFSAKHLSQIKDLHLEYAIRTMPTLTLAETTYAILGVDSTPQVHASANCLRDRSIVHDSKNAVTGRPINIGHEYSAVVSVSEDTSWVVPICLDRIPSTSSPATFGMQQVLSVCSKIKNATPVVLMDSRYNNTACRKLALEAKKSGQDPIFIIRSQCNRVYYIPAQPCKIHKGRPKQYGDPVNIFFPYEGAKPDGNVLICPENKNGGLAVLYWSTVYSKQKGMKGYEDPCSLIVMYELKSNGKMKYKRPMVLRIFKPKELSFNLGESIWLYFLRFAIEHYFSVLKKQLLFGKFHSPEVIHQEMFATLSALAYFQWYLAKESGPLAWTERPWHRYPKSKPKCDRLIPSHVQLGFSAVLQEIGTPSVYRLPKCIPPGRQQGFKPKKRIQQPVVRKTKYSNGTSHSLIRKIDDDVRSMTGEVRKQGMKKVAQAISHLFIILFLLVIKSHMDELFLTQLKFLANNHLSSVKYETVQIAYTKQLKDSYLKTVNKKYIILGSKGFMPPFENTVKKSEGGKNASSLIKITKNFNVRICGPPVL